MHGRIGGLHPLLGKETRIRNRNRPMRPHGRPGLRLRPFGRRHPEGVESAQGTPDIQGDHGSHGGHRLVRRSPQGRIHPLEDGSRGQGPRRKDKGPSHLRRKPMAPRALPDEHARPRGPAARFRDLRRRNRKDRQKPRRLREKGRRPLDPQGRLLHSRDARRVQMGGQGRKIRGLRRIRPLRRLGRPRRRDRNVDLRTGRRRKALRIRRPKRSPDPLVLVQRRRPDIGRIRFRKPPGGIRIRKRPARARRRCSRERNHIRLRRPVQACPRKPIRPETKSKYPTTGPDGSLRC